MRVTGGELSGREIKPPRGHRTHPAGDRVRLALFNMLGDVTDLEVLDAYAGSGALGIEALSRGAKSAQFVDIDKNAQSTIQVNLKNLGLDKKSKATLANIDFWSKRNPSQKFDLVFVDPPYDDVNLSTISLLTVHLKPKGLMVLSYPGRESAPTVNGVVVVDNRSYGNAALAFYRLD